MKEKNKKKKVTLKNVAEGLSKSRRIKNADGYFFLRAMLMLRGKARKTEAFPGQANCHGVMAMSQRTGGKGCLYRHTSSPGLTPTRRRSVGPQGAPSISLMAMP